MKAVFQERYGDTDVLGLRELDVPSIDDDEVLVQVAAAGLDRGVWHLMAGLPYMIRPAYGMRGPRQPVPGSDVAGTVTEVGRDVTRLAPGDEVFGIAAGSFAQQARAKEAKLAHKPSNVSFEQAAAIGVSGLTALQALRDQARVQAGEKVLIIGASGGVGTFAVQIAKAFGAEVTAVCSSSKVDLVRSIGADHVVDYTTQDLRPGPQDVIVDIAGRRRLRDLRRMLSPSGRLVLVGGEGGGRLTGGFLERNLAAAVMSLIGRRKMKGFVSKENAEDLQTLAGLVGSGDVTPVVDRTFPLAEAPEAIRYMVDGNVRGKVVITM